MAVMSCHFTNRCRCIPVIIPVAPESESESESESKNFCTILEVHINMFLERSWNRMNESTWRTLMLCLQSGGQSMPPMLSEWNSGTQRSASTYPLRYFDLACAKKIKVSMPTAIRFIAAYFTRVEQEVRWAAVDSTHSTAWINHIVPFVCDNLRAHHQWFVYQLALPSKNIHIICSFEHWLFIWSLFVQCSIVRNDTWYMIHDTSRQSRYVREAHLLRQE